MKESKVALKCLWIGISILLVVRGVHALAALPWSFDSWSWRHGLYIIGTVYFIGQVVYTFYMMLRVMVLTAIQKYLKDKL